MKKLLALSVALSLVSVQAFAQTATTPAPANNSTPAPATTTGPLSGLSAATGLSTPALVAIGVSIAAVAAVVADNNSDATTTHSTTTHHAR